MEVFRDQIHIEQIQKRLWCGREFGQAAIMVGAGFSRNADRISENVPLFPLWNGIMSPMVDGLYPSNAYSETVRNTHKKYGDPLKLSYAYETVFGRHALDDLILRAIPDSKYFPGRLHRLLLALPWSDIFTTNFDTLLERTLPNIHERKYDVVFTQSDIPRGMRPRIIKLHGSFPSYRPFILTEEDYRTYPKKFAPFVNMVQQSMMENIFCLIGFSGDDPNFSHWAGWVRDNLGEATPSIYLCGVLDLTAAQRRVLENKKIIPIDLGELFPPSEWTDTNLRHSKAMEWFLLTLMNASPPNVITWPNITKSVNWVPSDGIPPVSHMNVATTVEEKFHPSLPIDENELKEIYYAWKSNREKYPGWVVLPEENRESLWERTKLWVNIVIYNIDKLPSPLNILLLYELNWRLEKCRFPLDKKHIEHMVRVVLEFNPFPKMDKVSNARYTPESNDDYDWNEIGDCWIELIFSFMRHTREHQNIDQFCEWSNLVKTVVNQKSEWVQRWHYEQSLFYINQLDQTEVKKVLDLWPVTYSLPFWVTKRASILAELGDLNEAYGLAETALSEIRSHLKPDVVNYELFSQEGWAMFLLRALSEVRKFNRNVGTDETETYRDRWIELQRYRCDPWLQFTALAQKLKDDPPRQIPFEEVKRGFDPGVVTYTHHFSSTVAMESLSPAFALMRTFEDGGVPLMCGRLTIQRDSIFRAAMWTMGFTPFMSINYMVRSGEEKKTLEWFDRVRVATLEDRNVYVLADLFHKSLREAIQILQRGDGNLGVFTRTFSQLLMSILPKLLSRLCFRFKEDRLQELYEITLIMYKSTLVRRNVSFCDGLTQLFQRVLYAMEPEILYSGLGKLLELPIPGEFGFEVSEHNQWVEPFNYIDLSKVTAGQTLEIKSEWGYSIDRLIELVNRGAPDTRGRAAIRLERLCTTNLLTPEQKGRFAVALWSRTDENRQLPVDTYFTDVAFLRLPRPRGQNPRTNIKKYLQNSEFVDLVSGNNNVVGVGRTDSFLFDWIYASTSPIRSRLQNKNLISWTREEIAQLALKGIQWWKHNKSAFQTDELDLFGAMQEKHVRLSHFVQLWAEVILPNLDAHSTSETEIYEELLIDILHFSPSGLSALPALLYLKPGLIDEITQRLRSGMQAVNNELVKHAIIGVYRWITYSNRNHIIKPPEDLVDELILIVYSRRQPSLDIALTYTTAILKLFPQALSSRHISHICTGLDYLESATTLPNEDNRVSIERLSRGIAVEDLPEYRRLSAELAYQLYTLLKKRNVEIPECLLKWKNVSLCDSLPEVRRAWHVYD